MVRQDSCPSPPCAPVFHRLFLQKPCIRRDSLAKQSARPAGGHSHMDISTRQAGSATVVDVTGDITLYNSPDVRKVLMDVLKVKRAPRVIVNLKNVRYIDSAGVASLVEGLKVSRELKTGFALYGLSRTTREVLELTRLIKVFEVYENEEDALRAGSSAAPAH